MISTKCIGCLRQGATEETANEGLDLHTCPFAEEIYNDSETLCNCCKDCERECLHSI